MARTAVITGSASGIGKATSQLFVERGYRVIGVDIAGADVNVDLTTAAGREALVAEVTRLSGGTVDVVVANAGLSSPTAATAAVNYFGAVATLEGLRPLMAAAEAPRAVATASMASLFPVDDTLLAAFLAGDEPAALARAAELAAGAPETANMIYSTSKRALALWMRRNAPTPAWAGTGIALNGVAPGVVATPMTADLTATEEAKASLLQMVPMPLNGIFGPLQVAYLIAWLVSVENAHLCGQMIFIDGGSDAVIRGDSTW
ncbi:MULTISPECIES: SDR family NAD(P)-dependent oxidoreductase [unclassified Microbacterium]|uniref:SDR family NAD(P)-dependent oxidoreductase n=1 Tax=unclassified Microbacterium TaxID=2609290 RepID=UPI00214CA10B|nr:MULTISPECIES: SDR family NAD(P)-dependent oxidoreductase [unclassified Microbacterium]MCR2783107.1 SDR family NAD(P)-dependent oxidoreductase [Microbacterium sp. zg.B96]WIM16009.1 SDR family NAD(P)-dependent oxidoreductase [Microbacterium sp. zg-B96]